VVIRRKGNRTAWFIRMETLANLVFLPKSLDVEVAGDLHEFRFDDAHDILVLVLFEIIINEKADLSLKNKVKSRII